MNPSASSASLLSIDTQVSTASKPTLSVSELAPRILQSEIRAMSVECDRLGGINLAQGICDTEPPAVVLQAAKTAIDAGHNTYTRMDGIARLRTAIAAKLLRDSGMIADPDREILVTSGTTGGFLATVKALLNPGDEVILFEPFYGYHLSTLRAERIVPAIVPLTAPWTARPNPSSLRTEDDTDWTLDLDALKAAITSRTRAILINTPGNPSGKIFTRAELEAIAELAIEHQLFLFTDEIYEHFVYGQARHLSPAAIPGMRERTILMAGFSKTFSVTGWRLGYVVADARWLAAIGYFHDLLYICAPAPLQHGVAAGLEQLGTAHYRELARDHERKRARALAALQDAGLTPFTPAGAYYILAGADAIPGETAARKARDLLALTGVASVAGSAFFRSGLGENLLRFCFAKKDADLDEACVRLRQLRP